MIGYPAKKNPVLFIRLERRIFIFIFFKHFSFSYCCNLLFIFCFMFVFSSLCYS